MLDAVGKDITEGCTVAYAHTGRSGTHTLHTGVVQKINPKTVSIGQGAGHDCLQRKPEQVVVL